ncbi:ATP-binding protein, partial [Streptomyces sp. NPDC127574]|uniref:ATP-binding protein n=1 Tax=Streptomyces sp. NPDC127574 TaxID=3345401 RepID=UPI003635B828
MGAIPTQRESMACAPGAPAHHRAGQDTVARTTLPGTPLAPGAARRYLRDTLLGWAELALPGAEIIDDRLTGDAAVVVSELVTNVVVHAGTDVELLCRLEHAPDGPPGPLVIEVTDHHPARAIRDDSPERPYGTPEYGRGLRLVSALSEAWGITYRPGVKTVWARLLLDGSADTLPGADAFAAPDTRSPSDALAGSGLPGRGARAGTDGAGGGGSPGAEPAPAGAAPGNRLAGARGPGGRGPAGPTGTASVVAAPVPGGPGASLAGGDTFEPSGVAGADRGGPAA